MGERAADVGVPCSNGPFFAHLVQWVVWREGRRVSAIATTDERVSLDLPVEPASLVRPPLKPNGGPIDVLALSADSTQLLLVRFPAKNNERTAPPKLVWTALCPLSR